MKNADIVPRFLFFLCKCVKLWYTVLKGVTDMLDYIRIACIAPAVLVGNCEYNAEAICRLIQKADEDSCDIALFPELCLTGYTCGDLFFQKTLLDGAVKGIQQIADSTAGFPGMMVAVGAPLTICGRLYNCAVLICEGQVRGIVPKTCLPDDGSHKESRWFSGASECPLEYINAKQLGLAEDYEIPVGNDLLYRLGEGTLVGIEVCEDLFVASSPSAKLTDCGAEVILNLSAAPAAVGKHSRCRQLVMQQSGRCNCIYAYASAGMGESTQDMVFTGQCLVCENGQLLAEDGDFSAQTYLVADADLGRVRAKRRQHKSAPECVSCTRTVLCPENPLRSDGTLYPLNKEPFLKESEGLEVFQIQAVALARRLELLGAKPVVGVSGGLDSTLALLVATEACRILNRPAADVVGITMPCFGTTDRTYRNALKLMELLGVTALEVDIKDAVLKHFADIGQNVDIHDATYENCQARERTQVLMDYAGRVGGIVVGTGDMSELALGWCTYNADHMSMYGVNAGVPKTVIPAVIRAVMQKPEYAHVTSVLEDVLDTPISPELLPPNPEGAIAQQTEDLVGPYALHDFFLYYVLHYGFTPEKIYRMACRAFAGAYDAVTVKKWLKVFYKRFFTQQFKRSCLPEGVKVFDVSLSPRGDFLIPSDASAQLWLGDVERL